MKRGLVDQNIKAENLTGRAMAQLEIGADHLPVRAILRGSEVTLNQAGGVSATWADVLQHRQLTATYSDFGEGITQALPPESKQRESTSLSVADQVRLSNG